MATQPQIAANRRNAGHSTGPRTAAGKAAASRNRMRHGLTSKAVVLAGEDPAEFEDLRAQLQAEWKPANLTEQQLVDQIASQFWRLARAGRVETDLINRRLETAADLVEVFIEHTREFDTLRRYRVSAERAYFRAIEDLRKLQAARRREEMKDFSRIGFVSQPASRRAAEEPAGCEIESAPHPAVANSGPMLS